jgi:hypothetical protein
MDLTNRLWRCEMAWVCSAQGTMVGFCEHGSRKAIRYLKRSIFWDIQPCRQLTFNRPHSFISQKTELFIITNVRASNPTGNFLMSWITTNCSSKEWRFCYRGTDTFITLKMLSNHTSDEACGLVITSRNTLSVLQLWLTSLHYYIRRFLPPTFHCVFFAMFL